MNIDIFAQVYGYDYPAWEGEPDRIRNGIRRYREARRRNVPPEGTQERIDWFGLDDPEDLPIYPEPSQECALPEDFPADEALLPHIDAAHWHKSRGYVRPDKKRVAPHEYILREEHPDLFRLLRLRIVRGGGGYWGEYLGYVNWYLELGGYKYWASFVSVLNRQRIEDEEATA